MRIILTGGTGFVGAHCVRALLSEGHEVIMLVRDRTRVTRALEPLGVPLDRCAIVTGDLLDEAAVQRALSGADALLHAANVYSLKATDASIMHSVNVDATRWILRRAADQGLDPVVHVSSVAALLPSPLLTSQSPLGEPRGAYQRSKAAGEAIARELQDQGAPVVITAPASVFGPHDPHLGESAALVRNVLRGRLRVTMQGALAIVDVRDLADGHAQLFTAGAGPRRYLMAGHRVPFPELFRLLARVTGRRLPRMGLPGRVVAAGAKLGDVAHRRGIDLGFSSAGAWSLANLGEVDDRDTRQAVGVEWRSVTETLHDTTAWLHAEGWLTARHAGAAAAPWSTGGPRTPGPA